MADHEAVVTVNTWGQKVLAQLKYRAKAFVAGIGTLLVSELIVLLTDASFQGQVQGLVPPAYAFFVPVAFGLFVGLLTHGIANGPKPVDPSPSEEPAQTP